MLVSRWRVMRDVLARLDRLEALVARLMIGQGDVLLPALRRSAAGEWFTSGEVWRLALSEDEAASAWGKPRPELIEAMELEGICTAHGLGRWLAQRVGSGIDRAEPARGGVLWRVTPVGGEG